MQTIAVLIDAENAQQRTIGPILDELSKHGNVTARNAYGDWSCPNLKSWPTILEQLAIRPHHQFARSSGKNATDIALVIDAMDMFHTESFDAFAIVSSDGDFAGLASRLRRGGKYVFGFGEEKTPVSFRNACDDFVVTTLLRESAAIVFVPPAAAEDGVSVLSGEELKLIELLKSAASECGDADGWALASVVGAMIKRQRPDFHPKAFGCRGLIELIQKFAEHFELRRVPRGDGETDEYRERVHRVTSTPA